MKHYMKLLNFELNRFFPLYSVLVALVALVQLAGIVLFCWDKNRDIAETMESERLTATAYVEIYGKFSMEWFTYSGWFILPIIGAITVLVLYSLFIWYRDWFGKSRFMYRLLMLPSARRNIYFAKLTTILLCIFGLLSLQIVLIYVQQFIGNAMVDEMFREDISIFEIYQLDILVWLYPRTFADFVMIYGFGTLCMLVLFTAILLERSYQWKGIVASIVYALCCGGVLIAPFIVNVMMHDYFYAHELAMATIVLGLLIAAVTIWLADRLLTYKIKV